MKRKFLLLKCARSHRRYKNKVIIIRNQTYGGLTRRRGSKMCGIKRITVNVVIRDSCDETTNINTCYVNGCGKREQRQSSENKYELWSHLCYIKATGSLLEDVFECFRLKGFVSLIVFRSFIKIIFYLFIFFRNEKSSLSRYGFETLESITKHYVFMNAKVSFYESF